MVLIKENVEKIVNDASKDVIDQLLQNGWSKVTSPKLKAKVTKKTDNEVKKDDQTDSVVKEAPQTADEVKKDAQTV